MLFSNTAVVIPAYNENENLCILVKKIHRVSPLLKIIIVDDSAKPVNIELKRLLKIFNNIAIFSRAVKKGRGSAVILGLKMALDDKNINYIFEMDADLAHDPDEFKNFLEESQTADMVVGSRYLEQSRIVKWPLYRLVQSRVINFLLKYWLGINLNDYTNGFRLYNRKAAKYLVGCRLRESGFIALSEIAYKLKKAGFKISEIPISFTDRKYGKSNADYKELFNSLRGAVRIRFS